MVHVVHREVAHHDVLHHALIHFFQGQTTRPEERAVSDGDVAVAAIRFRSQFNTSAYPVHFLRHTSAVEQRSAFKARHRTVVDQYMLTGHRTFQSIRALQYDTVVTWGVHLRIAYRNHLAAVDVYAVAVCVDKHIVDGAQFTTRDDDGKMSAAGDGHVTDKDVAAKFQGDGLVAHADTAAMHLSCRFRIVLRESAAVDDAPSRDAHVLFTVRPDQRVMEIGMTAVLIFRSPEEFRRVVG